MPAIAGLSDHAVESVGVPREHPVIGGWRNSLPKPPVATILQPLPL
jgi:hypothetical protein